MSKTYLRLSVHQFVDFLFRVGDIDDRIYNQQTMQMGTKLHGKYQKEQGASYLSEFPLDGAVEIEEGKIFLQGRADGIIVGEHPIIDEVKTSIIPIEEFYEGQKQWHLAQAIVYAYLYLKNHPYDLVGIQLTYISQLDFKDKAVHTFSYTKEEINQTVEGYAKLYFDYYQPHLDHIRKRDASVKNLPFPFDGFRAGQKELANYVYKAIQSGSILFSEAPTGIGKTLSVLYPSVRSFKEHRVDRVFYLTAKQTGAQSAYDALTQLYESGLVARDSVLQAKEKICMCPGCRCNPSSCPYAEGYYTKIKEVIKEICSKTNRFDDNAVLEAAEKHTICPFELQLDLSLFADCIICDYNYLLDPMVYLERYFDESVDASTNVFLLDEAHNLIDRGKDMYSAELEIEEVGIARKALKGKTYAKTRKVLKSLEAYLAGFHYDNEAASFEIDKALFLAYIDAIKKARQADEKKLDESVPELTNLSRDLAKFRLILEDYFGPAYVAYTQNKKGKYTVKLHCLDASSFIFSCIKKGKSSVFFSATLSPMDYYQQTILGAKEFPSLVLPSPFSKDQMHGFVIPNISVRYKDRAESYPKVGDLLSTYVKHKLGNYFLFFPSYEYLEQVSPYLDFGDATVLMQQRSQTHASRKQFLDAFLPNPTKTTVGCYIIGGAFAEGVDLVSDRLIGVGIVGVGMPQINYESDLVRSYYEEKEGKGFDYAYLYPGLNKVAQALGRLIRTESDHGTALLIDDRYRYGEYKAMLNRLHGSWRYVRSAEELEAWLSDE